jgi:hypothetical protein
MFGDNSKGDVIGLGKIALSNDNSISNVYLVETLEFNLLSFSQLCEMGYNYLFTNEGVTVFRRVDSSTAFTGRFKEKSTLLISLRRKLSPRLV